MTVAHLVCGPVGSGKTTYARALATRLRAVHFSTGEWVAALYAGDEAGLDAGEDAQRARIERCEERIWSVVGQLLALGTSVVLDVELGEAAARDEWRTRVAGTPLAESKLHFLDVSRDTRLSRIQTRNQQASPAAVVSEARFNQLDLRFEPPTDDELYGAMILCED
jgi:predicted kinase